MNALERARWPLKAARREKRPEKGEELCCVIFILLVLAEDGRAGRAVSRGD